MTRSHKYFMWPFQSHFQIARKIAAENLFSKVSPLFSPEVFVIGVLAEDIPERHRSCVFPEEEYWIHSEDLSDIADIAESIRSELPESSLMHTHPVAQGYATSRLDRKSLRLAANQIINSHSNRPEHMTYFAGIPTRVHGFEVMTVVGVQKEVIEAFPRLESDMFEIDEYDKHPIPRSLVESVIEQFLNDCTTHLAGPNPGQDAFLSNTHRILEDAAKPMICGIATRCEEPNVLLEGGYAYFYDYLNDISETGYEKAEAKGRLVIARKEHPALRIKVKFRTPIPLSSTKYVRKLVEMTRDGSLLLHTNSISIWGLNDVFASLSSESLLARHRALDSHTTWITFWGARQ